MHCGHFRLYIIALVSQSLGYKYTLRYETVYPQMVFLVFLDRVVTIDRKWQL